MEVVLIAANFKLALKINNKGIIVCLSLTIKDIPKYAGIWLLTRVQ